MSCFKEKKETGREGGRESRRGGEGEGRRGKVRCRRKLGRNKKIIINPESQSDLNVNLKGKKKKANYKRTGQNENILEKYCRVEETSHQDTNPQNH